VNEDRGLPGDQDDELPPPVPPEARHPGLAGRLGRHRIDLTPLKVSADFRRLFVGQALSEFGTQITFVLSRSRSTTSPTRRRCSGCSP
jgi:hypothetical protein